MSTISLIESHELEEQIQRAVEAAIENKVQDIVNEVSEKECLNTREVMDKYNIPYRSQKHLRDTNQIAYTQYGKAIIYQSTEIINWIKKNRVKYERILER